jgi:hypothetical protein
MAKAKDEKYACNYAGYEKNSAGDFTGGRLEDCGEQADLMLKYETRFWPMYFGRIVFCPAHSKKIWELIESMVEVDA